MQDVLNFPNRSVTDPVEVASETDKDAPAVDES